MSACGSRGDVNPIAAIARELIQLGYECHISVAEPYADVVRQSGAIANVVVDTESFHQIVSKDSFWKPFAGARQVLSEVVRGFFQPHLDFIGQRYVPGQTVLVAHPLDFASRVFRDVEPTCRLTSIHLAPTMMRHTTKPPRLLPDRGWTRFVLPSGWRRLNGLTYWLGDRGFIDPILAPTINHARRQLGGLTKQRRLMNRWKDSPDQVLAMYPEWFAPEIVDENRSERFHFVGFPLDDGIEPATSTEPLPTNRPVLVTTGSAHFGDRVFIDQLSTECQKRNVPLVVCCPSNSQLFADTTRYHVVSYIPLGDWLPHCRALIHHGGIGTTSRAIHANIPQMIRPMAFDQYDHAQRIERFCLGVWLRNDRELATGLDRLLGMDIQPPSPFNASINAPINDATPQSSASKAASLISGLHQRNRTS